MKSTFLFLSLLFLCSTAWACVSKTEDVALEGGGFMLSEKTYLQLKALQKFICSDGYLADRTSIDRHRKEICE